MSIPGDGTVDITCSLGTVSTSEECHEIRQPHIFSRFEIISCSIRGTNILYNFVLTHWILALILVARIFIM